MIPTNKFRWLTLRETITAEQIREYWIANDCTIDKAKNDLLNKRGPFLQQFMVYDVWDVVHHTIEEAIKAKYGCWINIEHVTMTHEEFENEE
jgi:hypothetical protein